MRKLTITLDVHQARALARAASVRATKLLAMAGRGDRAGWSDGRADRLRAEAELVDGLARRLHAAADGAAAGGRVR